MEPVLKDHPMGHTDVVSQDWWSLATGSIYIGMWDLYTRNIQGSLYQEYLAFQDRGSLMAVVSEDRFYCNKVKNFSLKHMRSILFKAHFYFGNTVS